MTQGSDDRPPLAVAVEWSSNIMTVAFEMVLPGLGGYWLDARFGVTPLLTLLGFALGMGLATWHLVRMVSAQPKEAGRTSDRPPSGPG